MIIQTTFHAYLISYFPLSCTDSNSMIYVRVDNAKIFLIKLIKNPYVYCLILTHKDLASEFKVKEPF